MGHRRDFRVLGPVEVRIAGEPVGLGGRKQRSLLAILLLNANEVVSVDRLVDGLWGESPPETAATALHGHVSQLRKLLEPDRAPGAAAEVLVTREPGYVLRLEPGELDLERCERQIAGAREALAAGRPEEASELLRAALDLWRGRPLSDLENEPFAQAEIPRLDELRLTAVEERFEAELALGRHRGIVGDLERHVAQHPVRERPRGQLMLALYRSGRQAEALRAYQDARRALVDELGIEPGAELRRLEQAILDQDRSLDLEPRTSARPAPDARQGAVAGGRRRLAPAGLAAAVLAAAAAIAMLAGGDDDPAPAVAVRGGTVAVVDLGTNRVESAIPVGGTPASIAAGAGGVWVLDADRQTVSRIDPATRALRTFGTGGVPTDLSAGAGALWVANGEKGSTQYVGPLATTVSRIDPSTSAIRATVELPREPGAVSNRTDDHLAVSRGAVWAVNPDYSVSRIDPRTGQIAATTRDVSALAVAAGDQGVWTLGTDDSLVRIDRGGAGARRTRPASNGLAGIAVGAGAVWATAPYDGVLWRIDPAPRLVQRTIPVATGASSVTVGGGAVWVLNGLNGTVARVDPASNRVVATVELGATPRDAVVAQGKLWVAVAGAGSAPAAQQTVGGREALPEEACGPVFHGGGGEPDRLIVSDMPLRGGPRLPTDRMSQAIAFVLRQRGFRAGRFRVGYQSCDDSTSQTGIFDSRKCADNAKAWAAHPAVIGVVGPYNSGCAYEQIPIAGRAPNGPLAMLSPTNSDVGLTRAGFGTPEGGLRALYPTGRRHYARLFPTEAAQGAAVAMLARRLGARRVFALSDGGYGESMSFYFRRAAGRLGLRVAGSRRWDPRRRDYRRLGEAVVASGAGAVFVAGLLDSNGGAVVRAVREAAPDVEILGGDGFLPISGLFVAARDAARGVRVAVGGIDPSLLGPGGRSFVRDLAATLPGRRPSHEVVYAAAAANVMLDAIAASDGTRAGVVRVLRDGRERRGVLGRFRFDEAGDVVPAPVTIVRARVGGGSDAVGSTDGATVERVLRPPARLTR